MSRLENLSHDERVFLAGCIKTVMLADGGIEEAEVDDLDSIYKRLNFLDYERDLDEFERNVDSEESFFKEARKIGNAAAQNLILDTIYDLSLQNGAPADSQEGIFTKLNAIWRK
jgi:hypothetical protein